MSNRVFNLIVLDESGSMECIRQSAINSVNETLQTIRKAESDYADQHHFVTFVTFNSHSRTHYQNVAASEVADLKADQFNPNSLTALYDALGESINALAAKVEKGDKVLVTVVTDGEENSSREYSGAAVKALIDRYKGEGWVFAYMGANHDVEAAAASLSITNHISWETSKEGVHRMSTLHCKSRAKLYESFSKADFSAAQANENFFSEDDK